VPARSSIALRYAAWGLPVLVVGVLALPLFTNRTFGYDWPDHLWLVWQQAQSIAQMGRPSYFLQAYQGVYQPFFAFYGGTFYAVTGAVADLIGGHPTVAYCAAIIAAFAGAYVGWTWLALQAGLRGWRAQIPGLLYVTAPYIITTPFGRGDVPESIGTCAIPLVAASGLALLRAERVRPLPAAALVLSAAWFTACHNITSLWGTTFLALTAGVLLIAVGRRRVRPRRILEVLGLAALGVAINAWFLFPAIAYSGRTAIEARGGIGAFQFDAWQVVFDPFRSQPETSTAGILNTQMPVLAFVWALVVLAIAWRRMPMPWRRFAAGMALIVVALLALILTNMSIVPRPWSQIQFPYRAQTYVALGVCATVLAAVAAIPFLASRRLRSTALGALVVIAATSFGQAIHQQWRQPSQLASRSLIFQGENKHPPSWYSQFDYADISMPAVPFGAIVGIPGVTVTGGNFESILVVPTHGHSDINTVTFPSPGPRPIATNVYGGPYLVKVTGARAIARTPTNELVIEPLAPKGQQAKVTFSTAHTVPVVLGVATTLAALAVCLLLAAWAIGRAVRGRQFSRLAQRERGGIPG
jgi:hypothetical protein